MLSLERKQEQIARGIVRGQRFTALQAAELRLRQLPLQVDAQWPVANQNQPHTALWVGCLQGVEGFHQ